MKLLNEANLVYFSTCPSHTTKEGWLSKRGEVNRSFQKRWFVLKGNLLFYFEKPGDRAPIGVIILEGYTVELATCGNNDGFTFQIVFHGGMNARKYILQAESHQVMDDWMKCITRASYDYMKIIVHELKAQLDELSAQELSMELKECKTRDPFDEDLLLHTTDGSSSVSTAAGGSGQSARLNPFDKKLTDQTGSTVTGAAATSSTNDSLDVFGQVPFSSFQQTAASSQLETPKVPDRKKYKHSPRLQKKFSTKPEKTAEPKAGASQFYSAEDEPVTKSLQKLRVKSQSKFLDLHLEYGEKLKQTMCYKGSLLEIS